MTEARLGWLDWLLPRYCLACAVPLAAGRRPAGALGLCLGCEERLVRIDREPACALCAERLPAGRICGGCATEPPPWRRLHALWLYAPPLRELVHAWKFRRLDFLGRPLGEILGREIRRRSASSPSTAPGGEVSGLAERPDPSSEREAPGLPDLPDLVVPMPLAWTRRLARGFNQTEGLANAVAGELGLPVRRALRRGPALGHQTGRSRRERLDHASAANRRSLSGHFSGRFRPAPFARLAGRRILLVDDVLTTGATARGAAAELLRAGAAAVDLAVVARTPERSRPEGGPAGSPEPRPGPPERPIDTP